MSGHDPLTLITADERRQGDPTPGMVREEAIALDGMWAGLVHTAPGMVSGWHHHGDHDTAVFVVRGRLRMEFGHDGRETIDAGEGDFVHVPKGVIHRESNPGDGESQLVVVRAGSGPPTANVAGPQPSADIYPKRKR